jgi:hypothetical protein
MNEGSFIGGVSLGNGSALHKFQFTPNVAAHGSRRTLSASRTRTVTEAKLGLEQSRRFKPPGPRQNEGRRRNETVRTFLPLETAPNPTKQERTRVLAAAGVLVLAVIAAYHNSLSGPFVFDDPLAIVENPTIRKLWPLSDVLLPPRGEGLSVEGRRSKGVRL